MKPAALTSGLKSSRLVKTNKVLTMNSNQNKHDKENRFGLQFPPNTPSWLQEHLIQEARLDSEAEFRYWCKRQVRKGNGKDCSSTSSPDERFIGLRCFNCSFVFINPTSDIVDSKTPLHLLAERIGNSITDSEEELTTAMCPKCGDICICLLYTSDAADE